MRDLLVVGGGPAGLATAAYAALAGLDVAVAEPRRGPVDKACGEGLMPGAVARLAALGVQPEGRPFRGIRYLDGTYAADAAFPGAPGLGVRRTVLHAALAERVAALGVPVLPVRVSDVEQDADGVTARGAGGETLRARRLAAADGLHSPVRRALGLDRPVRTPPRYGLRRHHAVAPWSDLVEVHWSPHAEAYVTPVAPGLVGVAVLTSRRAPYADQLLAFPALAARLADAGVAGAGESDARESDARESDHRILGAGPLRQAAAARVAGRVLLVGDAAGYVDALTGEGVAVALASAAALVGCLVAGRPDAYERAWRRHTRSYRWLTSGLLAARRRPALARRVVPAAARLPRVFGAAVGLLAG